MSDEPIDFSSIDPSRDEKRWERMLARTAERGLAARLEAKASVTVELARLTWPLTVVAAIVVAMALALGPGSTATPGSLTADSVSEWANNGEIPRSVDVVALTGDGL